MDMNTIYMIAGASLFILPVTFMLGYVWHEKQRRADYAATIEHQAKCHSDWQQETVAAHNLTQKTSEDMYSNVLREVESNLLLAGQNIEVVRNDLTKMENQWKYADRYRKAIVETMCNNNIWDFMAHGDNPTSMLEMLVEHYEAAAVDPTVSKKAKNLYVRGVRAGAKKGRAQMSKIMQKAIDNQAATIDLLQRDLFNANGRRQMFTEAVTNVVNDKLALPGVRRAFTQAIIQEHDRLRAVAVKKGA